MRTTFTSFFEKTTIFNFSILAMLLFGNAIYAQFPQVGATNTSLVTTAGQTHNINLPAGIQSGDLLIVFYADASGASTATLPTGQGWTPLYNSLNSNRRAVALYKVATGSEGSSVTITTDANERSAHNSYRISAGTYSGTPVSIDPPASGQTATPDPPNLTPIFGSSQTLWIASSHSSGDDNNPTPSAPSNYSSLLNAVTGDGNTHARMLTARRTLAAASEIPEALL